MKKILKNKTVLGSICIALGFLVAFVISPALNRRSEARVTVVKATKTIELGDKITAEMVQEIDVSRYNLPNDLFGSKNDVIGKYSTIKMIENDLISQQKISETPPSDNTYLYNLSGGKRAISVSLKTLAKGLSGKIQTGDIVSIIVPDEEQMTSFIPDELKYVEVIAVTDSGGADVTNDNKTSTSVSETVTLLVTDEQATILAILEDTKNIHLSLVYRGDKDSRKKYTDEQENILKATYPGQYTEKVIQTEIITNDEVKGE